MLQYQTISPNLLNVFRQLMKLPELAHFRLVGGTSLSLQIGHRQSIDIDLFSDKDFDLKELQGVLVNSFDSFVIDWQNKNGFTARIDNIKVDFFNWHVAFVRPPVIEDNLVLMDKEEIGAMKLEAITTRKEKKDYVDIFFLLQYFSLHQLINDFKLKYPFVNHKFAIESLYAIDYADETELPVLLKPFEWNEAKKFIIKKVNEYFEIQQQLTKNVQDERLRKAEELLNKRKTKPTDD